MRRPGSGTAGFTILELAVTVAMLSVFLVGIAVTTIGLQNAFFESQTVSQLNLRAQNALDRIVSVASQALTGDAAFSPLKPTSGVDSHCLRFRLIQSIDAATGAVVYDDTARVYIYGPDGAASPNAGVIIGRGSSLSAVHSAAAGPDGLLGTSDDDITNLVSGVPVEEILLTDRYAPSSGEMFTVDVNGRLLTFTLRLNARRPDDTFVFPNDLVLTERVALRQ